MNKDLIYQRTLCTLMALAIFALARTSTPAQVPNIPEPAARAPQSSQEPDGESKPLQTSTPAAPHDPALRPNFFKTLLRDQKTIFSSPLAIKKRDARWLVPLAGVTAILIATDRRVAAEIGSGKDPLRHSNALSSLGSGYVTFGAAGSMFALGALSHQDRLRETGILGLEALIDSAIVGGALKAISRRERPSQSGGEGHFWDAGNSFPSGHTMTAWALAAVVAQQYPDKPVVRIGAYAFATAVGISRVTGHSHFPSDALVGASLGYLIGRYVVRAHGKGGSQRAPRISPYFSQPTRSYGARVSLPL